METSKRVLSSFIFFIGSLSHLFFGRCNNFTIIIYMGAESSKPNISSEDNNSSQPSMQRQHLKTDEDTSSQPIVQPSTSNSPEDGQPKKNITATNLIFLLLDRKALNTTQTNLGIYYPITNPTRKESISVQKFSNVSNENQNVSTENRFFVKITVPEKSKDKAGKLFSWISYTLKARYIEIPQECLRDGKVNDKLTEAITAYINFQGKGNKDELEMNSQEINKYTYRGIRDARVALKCFKKKKHCSLFPLYMQITKSGGNHRSLTRNRIRKNKLKGRQTKKRICQRAIPRERFGGRSEGAHLDTMRATTLSYG